MLWKTLKNPTSEQREAIGRLQFTRDGKALQEYLNAAINEANDRIMKDDDPHRVRMHQGECRTLRGLIDLLTPVSS